MDHGLTQQELAQRVGTRHSQISRIDEVGQVLYGGAVGQVVASRTPAFTEGDVVLSNNGWREYFVADGSGLERIAPVAPLSYYLGVLGMPGMTAYVGLLDIGQPKAGETVFVSAASGAVGSVVGQLARIKGCRAIGGVGSDGEVRFLRDELGFNACLLDGAGDGNAVHVMRKQRVAGQPYIATWSWRASWWWPPNCSTSCALASRPPASSASHSPRPSAPHRRAQT